MAKESLKSNIADSDSSSEHNDEEEVVILNGGTASKEYQIGKNAFLKLSCSERKDIVFDKYRVNFKKPLPEFDTKTGNAYSVTDTTKNDSETYYALALDRRYPSRLTEINKLINQNIPHFTNVLAAQIINTSIDNGRSFIIVIEKPKGIKLSDFIASNGPINEDAIINRIIKPLFNIISQFESKLITHGKININNLYIDNVGNVTLGECFSEPCGFSQPIIYESTLRASAIPIGKGKGEPGLVDYFALAVCVAICIRGRNLYGEISNNSILNLKYEKNTYKMVCDGVDISPYMMDFLRGAINDNIRQTWNHERMTEWLGGRRYNLLPPTENIDAGRPILFNDNRYLSKKHLAYAMYKNWDEAKKFIKESTLMRWIERSVQDDKLAEKIDIIQGRFGGIDDTNSKFNKDDELLAQHIMLLDPLGPIRIKQVSVNVDGIGVLLADALAKKDEELIEAIKIIIKHSLVSYKDFGAKSNIFHSAEKDDALVLQRCSDLFRKRYRGFGIERVLYEMCPEIPCQSELLKGYYVCVVQDMFDILEKNKNLSNENFDESLIAFISSKLELPVKLRIKSLGKFPEFANLNGIENLALLSACQQSFSKQKLPNLCNNVYGIIDDAIETFHSKSIRKDIRDDIQKKIKKGNLTEILSVITDRNYLLKDKIGFRRAVVNYRNNTLQIIKLNNKKTVNNMGYLYGLQLSVVLTFFLATLVVIILIIKMF
jgi:hypothetical protein